MKMFRELLPRELTFAVDYAAPVEVVWRQGDTNPVAGNNSDVMLAHFP